MIVRSIGIWTKKMLTNCKLILTNLERSSKKWQLPFNPSKYKVMHFDYDRVLDTVTQEKDLGVIVDDQMKFHEHTAVAAKKANQILGLIKKCYSSRESYTITTFI